MLFHCDRTLSGFRHLGNPLGLTRGAMLRTLGKRVWAVGEQGALVSSDGTACRLHGALTDTLLDVASAGGELVMLAKGGVLLISPDGLHWARQQLSGGPDLTRILTLAEGVLLALGPAGALRRDTGGQWSAVPMKDGPALKSGHVCGDGTVLLVGEKGRCLVSRDAGLTFKPTKLPTTVTLHAVHANDRGDVVAVGDKGTLVHSGDGGRTWNRRGTPSKRDALVTVFVGERLFVASSCHQTVVSRDGGLSWEEYVSTSFQALSGPLTPGGPLWGLTRGELATLPLQWPAPPVPQSTGGGHGPRGWGLGVEPEGAWNYQSHGRRWRSTDEGLTWDQAAPIAEHPATDIAGQPRPPYHSRDDWAGGGKSVTIVAPDGAVQTWTPTLAHGPYGAPPKVYCGVELPSGTWLDGGEYGVLVRSTDRGKTCSSRHLIEGVGSLTRISARRSVVLAGGWYSLAFQSNDDGCTWTRLDIPGRGTAVWQFLWLGDSEVMIFLDRGCLALVSQDAGQTWQRTLRPDLPGWPPHRIEYACPVPGGGLLCWMSQAETQHDQR
jgi:photosystem II stability/assembly factor-like uncharacterized protein